MISRVPLVSPTIFPTDEEGEKAHQKMLAAILKHNLDLAERYEASESSLRSSVVSQKEPLSFKAKAVLAVVAATVFGAIAAFAVVAYGLHSQNLLLDTGIGGALGCAVGLIGLSALLLYRQYKERHKLDILREPPTQNLGFY